MAEPTYVLEDPTPIAREAPYTFFLPSNAELAAIGSGDLVKLIFRAIPPSQKWDAERMWVIVDRVGAKELQGVLDNQPSDMPQLSPGATVTFKRHHVVALTWRDPDGKPPPSDQREYWERCLVDACVLDEGVAVSYVYREEPDMGEPGDRFPDSGWRIRGDYRGLSDEEIDDRKMQYVAIGAVLNRDDSWLGLIDEPIGAAFLRDFDTGVYVPESS